MQGTPTSQDGSEDFENNPDEDNQSVAIKPTFAPGSESRVDTSHHADLRWIQRAHELEHRAGQAWHRAKTVLLDSREFDRVRYDEQTDTLLCVNGKTLITVLSAEYESFAPIRSDETTTVRCVACGSQRNHASDGCPHCGSEFVADSTYTVTTQEGQ